MQLSISVVSHAQASLLEALLEDLERISTGVPFEVILTVNAPETLTFNSSDFSFPIRIIENTSPKGFGANHNAAFKIAVGAWFCVINPDIRLPQSPFNVLIQHQREVESGIIAPAVVNSSGLIADSVRKRPTIFNLTGRVLGISDASYRFRIGDASFPVDWVAGMFMLFRSDAFQAVGGFDEAYFLYFEDADICMRLWRSGRMVLVCPQAVVVHDAQRSSHKNFRYFKWHLASMVRFFSNFGIWRFAPRARTKPRC